MATLVKFGNKGINLDQVISWQDGIRTPEGARQGEEADIPCLSITFAVSESVWEGSTYALDGTVIQHYEGADRRILLHALTQLSVEFVDTEE